MKKTYKIEVDCANCADKMECAAAKVAGVESVTVNFMTQKMIVSFKNGFNTARGPEKRNSFPWDCASHDTDF